MSEVRLGAVAFIEPSRGFASSPGADPRPEIEAAGGEVVQTLDRLVVAWFGSASACARGCAGLSDPGARAGLSVGDVLLEDGLLRGLPVVEASRLMYLARPGQVLCTARLARLADLPEGASRSLGEMRLKGIDRSVDVCALR